MCTGSQFGTMVRNLLTSAGTLSYLSRALLNGIIYLDKNGMQCVYYFTYPKSINSLLGQTGRTSLLNFPIIYNFQLIQLTHT